MPTLSPLPGAGGFFFFLIQSERDSAGAKSPTACNESVQADINLQFRRHWQIVISANKRSLCKENKREIDIFDTSLCVHPEVGIQLNKRTLRFFLTSKHMPPLVVDDKIWDAVLKNSIRIRE